MLCTIPICSYFWLPFDAESEMQEPSSHHAICAFQDRRSIVSPGQEKVMKVSSGKRHEESPNGNLLSDKQPKTLDNLDSLSDMIKCRAWSPVLAHHVVGMEDREPAVGN